MDFKIILKESWEEFTTRFTLLLKATASFIAASIVASALVYLLFNELGVFASFVISVAILVIESMITLAGVKYLYSQRGIEIDISSNKIFIYLFASMYIGVASTLGFFFFVIPGIIVLAVTFLMPIYILKESQGPIEAVASSASLMKECYMQVTLFLFCIWVIVAVVEYVAGFVLGFIPLPGVILESAVAALSLIISLYSLTVMVALYTHLEIKHNKSSSRDAVTGAPS